MQTYPLVERCKIILPPLHVKLGIMKQFVKALNKDGDCFKYIGIKFLGSTIEKLKASIFDDPQTRKLINDHDFTNSMNKKESCVWSAFVKAVEKFLGNRKEVKYKQIVAKLLSSLQDIGANMSIKLDRFPANLGFLSNDDFIGVFAKWKLVPRNADAAMLGDFFFLSVSWLFHPSMYYDGVP